MYAFLRRAAWFILPLVFISGILFLFKNSIPNPADFKPLKTVMGVGKKVMITTISTQTSTATPTVVGRDSFFTVVLDPAHGGDDVGNMGINSVVESHINLQFAFKLARSLRMKGIKVFLTRMDDYNVPLERRFQDAQKQNPNIYLSINCAYSDKKPIYGMEVFGFTPDVTEGDLERTTNKFYEFYEGSYVTKSQEAMVVENRVSLTLKQELSLPYKSRLERKFIKSLALPSNIPALSIFIGYISNYGDSRLLSDEKQVDALAEKMATAIEDGLTKKI